MSYQQQEAPNEERWREEFETKWPGVLTWPGRNDMNVYQKLNAARQQFHALKLSKTGHNKFAGYNYFELGDFLLPALSVFREVGLCATVSFDKETATMSIVDADKPDGERIVLTSPMGSAALKGCHEVQNIGAVETYQRRYLWVAALEIVEHDALDATTGREHKGPIADSFRSSPTNGAVEDVDPDRVLYLTTLASVLAAMVDKGDVAGAYDKLVREKFDDTEYTALWEILKGKSYVRSKLKAHGESIKAARKAAEGATA